MGSGSIRRGIIDMQQFLLLFVVVGVACAAAWELRWLQDDAYITFRYSKNMIDGLGPVWNEGYRVEGYTNSLWMFIMAIAGGLGFDIPASSQVLGILLFACSLTLAFLLARQLRVDFYWAILTPVLLAANFSFLKYATGGLETQLIAALTTAGLLITVQTIQSGRMTPYSCVVLSLILALSLMTRLDSGLLCILVGSVALYYTLKSDAHVRNVLLLVFPGALIIGAWLYWKFSFYGSILPNTFHAKASNPSGQTALRGAVYVAWPFVSFGWFLVIAWLAWGFARTSGFAGRLRSDVVVIIGYIVMWYAYLIWAGGDIMEYRLHIPVFPVLMVLLAVAATKLHQARFPTWPIVGILVLGSIFHGLYFPRVVYPLGIGTIQWLTSDVDTERAQSWSNIGKKLREYLGEGSNVTIAVNPAGAIPYYSGLRSIDMLGLNDIWIARNGYERKTCDVCQAHRLVATIEYLNSQKVNMVFGKPITRHNKAVTADPIADVRWTFLNEELDFENLPDDAQVVWIPLQNDYQVMALYLQPSDEIETLLEEGSWGRDSASLAQLR